MEQSERFRLQNVDLNHPALQISMPLVSNHDGELRCIGTAFAVAPGLAITAEHVVEDWMGYQKRRDGYNRAKASFSVTAVQVFEGKLYEWIVDEVSWSRAADIAFLRFRRPPWWGDGAGQVKPRCARLNFNPPAPGDEVRVFGFPKSEVNNGILYVSPVECLCRVQRVDLKTAITSRPLSHMDIEGEIHEGMSGGPCFDSNWNVVGVNSKGWDLLGGSPLAHVALLWPALNVPIDLFKSGAFPALDLFKEGPLQALGYRRVYVTSTGEARLAKVDPDNLEALVFSQQVEHLEGALNFAASNAREALAEIRDVLDKAFRGVESLDTNGLYRSLRSYFWELDSVLRLALRLTARRVNLPIDGSLSWEQFVSAWWTSGADAETRDKLAELGFSWHGAELFEIRTYADLGRIGALLVQCGTSVEGRISFAMLEMCRKKGDQVSLPDGLDRFWDASRRFVQKLLYLSNRKDVS